MASRSPWDLNPELRRRAAEWVRLCTAEGLEILITCTYRSAEEQATLYAQGRTTPDRRVTNAKPGQSRHNTVGPGGLPAAEAFDFVPMRAGKCVWGTTAAADRALWEQCIVHAEALGLVCGARWPRLQDWPHVELPRVAP
jgi:peptidoglycan L-alanyl-D-glutamate endopeptidase CwlK